MREIAINSTIKQMIFLGKEASPCDDVSTCDDVLSMLLPARAAPSYAPVSTDLSRAPESASLFVTFYHKAHAATAPEVLLCSNDQCIGNRHSQHQFGCAMLIAVCSRRLRPSPRRAFVYGSPPPLPHHPLPPCVPCLVGSAGSQRVAAACGLWCRVMFTVINPFEYFCF